MMDAVKSTWALLNTNPQENIATAITTANSQLKLEIAKSIFLNKTTAYNLVPSQACSWNQILIVTI